MLLLAGKAHEALPQLPEWFNKSASVSEMPTASQRYQQRHSLIAAPSQRQHSASSSAPQPAAGAPARKPYPDMPSMDDLDALTGAPQPTPPLPPQVCTLIQIAANGSTMMDSDVMRGRACAYAIACSLPTIGQVFRPSHPVCTSAFVAACAVPQPGDKHETSTKERPGQPFLTCRSWRSRTRWPWRCQTSGLRPPVTTSTTRRTRCPLRRVAKPSTRVKLASALCTCL